MDKTMAHPIVPVPTVLLLLYRLSVLFHEMSRSGRRKRSCHGQVLGIGVDQVGNLEQHAPYERFRQYVQERFRMSVEELYALPANQG